MIVAIVCATALVLALGYLSVLVGGLMQRLSDLERQLATAREHAARLSEVLAQAPRRSS